MVEITQHGWFGVFFALLIGHAFGDFAFQSEFVSNFKNQSHWKRDGQESGWSWLIVLSAHSLIHSGLVWLVTGTIILGVAEFVLHLLIDKLKGDGNLSFVTDQMLHVACKVGFVIYLCFA